MKPVDFEIPVGWGHIAGKAWGKPNTGFPVLCVHGIQDNAGTFDRLIPLLPKRFYWVAIDLPGHGHSSPFEDGHPIEFTHLVYSLKRVVDHFMWTKFYVMGHSLGAQLCTFFSGIYPDLVVKAVFLDGLIPSTTPSDEYAKALCHKFDQYHAAEKALSQKTAPSYSRSDAIKRLIKNRPSMITNESAKALIKRSLAVSGDGFRYSTDQRFKLLPLPLITLNQCLNLLQSIKCQCLLIIAQDSLEKMKKNTLPMSYYSETAIKAMEMFPNFTYKVIPGQHDVHLNDPKSVAALVIPFLEDTQSSL
ncbi:Hypothetical protein NTJ_07191 [Nesidiocoris tenuis]|uniref:AB hydrolase-1 domain-containing protein n=1 Tax=Nesidiocoris tenuis TaxID=355587 RepID=A0ABN7ASR0_9HEMI|nr:Hypothetical protein NTJ_07191 [Nesidiocoris tenuis]